MAVAMAGMGGQQWHDGGECGWSCRLGLGALPLGGVLAAMLSYAPPPVYYPPPADVQPPAYQASPPAFYPPPGYPPGFLLITAVSGATARADGVTHADLKTSAISRHDDRVIHKTANHKPIRSRNTEYGFSLSANPALPVQSLGTSGHVISGIASQPVRGPNVCSQIIQSSPSPFHARATTTLERPIPPPWPAAPVSI
jgi:hypothetical protein